MWREPELFPTRNSTCGSSAATGVQCSPTIRPQRALAHASVPTRSWLGPPLRSHRGLLENSSPGTYKSPPFLPKPDVGSVVLCEACLGNKPHSWGVAEGAGAGRANPPTHFKQVTPGFGTVQHQSHPWQGSRYLPFLGRSQG